MLRRLRDVVGEKLGQLLMLDARGEDLSFVNTRQPGALLHILGEKIVRAMDLAAKNRLAIPLLVGEDGIHGHSFWRDANIFPTQLAPASSSTPSPTGCWTGCRRPAPASTASRPSGPWTARAACRRRRSARRPPRRRR
jgi:hypothetical protein